MKKAELLSEVRGNAIYDAIKEVAKLMLPAIAALGIKQWAIEHADALMWVAALIAAAVIAYADRLLKPLTKSAASDPQLKLTIHSAKYCAGDKWDLRTDELRKHIKPRVGDHLLVAVRNHNLGGDFLPPEKKRLCVIYSIGEGPKREITKDEYEILCLPEPLEDIEKRSAGEIEKLKARVVRLNSPAHLRFWKWAGCVEHLAENAGALRSKLEAVWHLWNNSGKEKLIYPLSVSVVPDEIRSWEHKQLLEFRILYRNYLAEMSLFAPSFQSALRANGFPCDGRSYLQVMSDLEFHDQELQQWLKQKVDEFLSSQSEA